MASIDKKISCKACGPGGMKCRCCGPSPGKPRKRFKRNVKRGKVKEFVRKETQEQQEE